MKVNEELVDKLAQLSRLEFDAQSKKQIMIDLQRMIALVDKLNEIDTSNVEPLKYITEEPNVLRKDEINKTITQEEALSNAPLHDSDYFKVPKVIKK